LALSGQSWLRCPEEQEAVGFRGRNRRIREEGVPMARQIGWRNAESPAAIEYRMHKLEDRMTALTEAVRVLARGLENLPATEPGGKRAAEAARRAYALLLVSEPAAQPGQHADA
jgi:hypothetical protein